MCKAARWRWQCPTPAGWARCPVPCSVLTPCASELAAIKAQTSRPFNVNFFCHAPPTPSAEREAAWRAALAPYYKEFGIDVDTIPVGPGRAPFSSEAADVLDEFKPAVVSFHFGLPSADLLARVRAWGSKIFSSATTVEEARWLEAHGVDAIIAQGLEAGGHRGIFLSDDLSYSSRHVCTVAANRAGSEAPGDCCRRHRGCERCCGCHGARRGRRTDWNGLSALP